MLNHIAVILRGHTRTWKLIYPYCFDFYEKIASKVDYYFVSWQGSQHNTNIVETFNGRHLEVLLLLTPTPDFDNSFQNASYSSYMVLPYKHKREKSVKYDLVIDSRPDVIPVLQKNKTIIAPEPNILYTTQFELQHNFRYNELDIAVSDWYMCSTSEIYDIMATRWAETNDQSTQITIRTFAEKNNLFVNRLAYAKAFMARPNIIEAIRPDQTLDTDQLSPLTSSWYNMSRDEKIAYCERQNIPLYNYMTGSATCSI
jgi:hypothetical protein